MRWVRCGREARKVGGRHGREDEIRERSVREEMVWEEGRLERGVADGRLVQEREEEEGQVQWWVREGGNWQTEREEGVGCRSRSIGSKREKLVSNISLLENITQGAALPMRSLFKSQGKNVKACRFSMVSFLALFRVSLKVAPTLVNLSEKTHRVGRQAYRGQLGPQR